MFHLQNLESTFNRIGARLKLENKQQRFTIDIDKDRAGEHFLLNPPVSESAELTVLNVEKRNRHLLLMHRDGDQKSKFLCGHDERHWFVAAIPEAAPVGTVRAAMESLKPEPVRAAQSRARVSGKASNTRKNAAFRRQGEWFLIPEPTLVVPEDQILKNEPISRGVGSKAHFAEFCARIGGTEVFVSRAYPAGLELAEYRWLIKENPEAKFMSWRKLVRDATVYICGRLRHADHNTINLHCWHQVVMNTENRARAMRHVVFLD